jgi:hypothetical protein
LILLTSSLVFDLIHVSTIHNSSIPSADLLTGSTLFQLQTRADQHEWGLAYNSSEPVRAIAGSVLAGQVLQALNGTLRAALASKSAQRLTIQFGAYASFLSFFGLSQLPAASATFQGIPDYSSSMVFELVTNASLTSTTINPADVSVRFLFSNGTGVPQPFALFGRSDPLVSWTDFTSEMTKFAIADTTHWCTICGNSTGVCADALGLGSGSGSANTTDTGSSGGGGGGISLPVAGVIGALVTLVVVLGVEALVMGCAGLTLAKKRPATPKGA